MFLENECCESKLVGGYCTVHQRTTWSKLLGFRSGRTELTQSPLRCVVLYSDFTKLYLYSRMSDCLFLTVVCESCLLRTNVVCTQIVLEATVNNKKLQHGVTTF